jgi:4-amino-4-deoxy-L-arabinose transferase-like glycosyltransferase
MTWILWVVSIALVAGFVIAINSIFVIKQRSLYLLSAHVWGLAQLVGVGQILSLTSRLNQPEAFLVVQAVFTVAAFVVWVLCKRPALMPVEWNLHELRTGWDTLRQEPLTFALTLTAIIVTTISLLYVILLPQNIDDVLTAYLPRMATWLQTGEIRIVETSVYNFPQVTYPVVPQLVSFWVILFTKQVGLSAIMTWINVPLIATAIYVLGRHFGGTRKQAAIAALLWMISPGIFDLSFTLMSDLVLITLVMTTLLFLWLGLEQKQNGLLVGSAVAFGLAIGTKEITLIMLPGALVMGGLWLWHYKTQWRQVIVWAVLAVVMVSLLGSFAYVNNYLYYGSPFGARDVEAATSSYGAINIGRLLNPIDSIFHFMKSSSRFQNTLFINASPVSWIQSETIIIYLLIGIALVFNLTDSWKKRDKRRLGFLAFILSYLAILFTVRNYTEANVRYLMVMTAIGMAFAAPLLGEPLQNLWSRAIDRVQKLPKIPFLIGVIVFVVFVQVNSLRYMWKFYADLMGYYINVWNVNADVYHFMTVAPLMTFVVFPIFYLLRKPLSQLDVMRKINLLIVFNTLVLIFVSVIFHFSGLEIVNTAYHLTSTLVTLNVLALISIRFIDVPYAHPAHDVLPISSPFYRFVVVMSIVLIVLRVLFSSMVPWVGSKTVFTMNPIEFSTFYYWHIDFEEIMINYETHVQPTDTVGILLPYKFPLSMLYGDDLSRPVEQVYPYPPIIDADYVRSLGYDFVIVDSYILDEANRDAFNVQFNRLGRPCGSSLDFCIHAINPDGLQMISLNAMNSHWLLSLQD